MVLLQLLTDYRESLAAFALFGVLHSLCAREACKNLLALIAGRLFVDCFWRFAYCAASYWALYHAISPLHWGLHPNSDLWLVVYPEWLWQAVTALHLFSIAVAYAAFLQSDYLEFLGFKQMWRGLRKLAGRPAPASLPLFGTERLVVGGVYGWVRHPMLAAGFLFLLTSGPSLNNLVFLFLYTVYMLVGGTYEERRLIRIFGGEYLAYRRRVGAYFPKKPPKLPPKLPPSPRARGG